VTLLVSSLSNDVWSPRYIAGTRRGTSASCDGSWKTSWRYASARVAVALVVAVCLGDCHPTVTVDVAVVSWLCCAGAVAARVAGSGAAAVPLDATDGQVPTHVGVCEHGSRLLVAGCGVDHDVVG
jgi:hypothetical protein